MKYYIIIVWFFIGSDVCHSQKEDYNWVVGGFEIDPNIDIWGINIFNFTEEGLMLKKIGNSVHFGVTNTAISDFHGKALFYSNGMDIYDTACNILSNGDSINYNNYWELWRTSNDKVEFSFGLRLSQGMIMLAFPGHKDSIVWIASNVILGNKPFSEGLFIGIIDAKQNQVMSYGKFMQKDTLNYNIQSCRHANGRDWWIIVSGLNHNKYYTYLLDPNGIRLDHIEYFFTNYPSSNGQAFFSPQGDKYVVAQQEGLKPANGHVSIFDFDRNTGKLSNLRYKTHVMQASFCGCSFSLDGSKLYFSNYEELFQLDMTIPEPFSTMKLVAKSDLYPSVYPDGFSAPNGFVFMHLAPDGKIYGPGGNTFHTHIIEYPDEEGEACNVRQHALKTVSNGLGTPNFPNFRLGPLDGSPADTLGLDNNPIAKYRYEADTTNHLNVRFTDLSYYRPEQWTWDFGDGTTFDGRKPYWHTFPKNGTYNVCLTVSNENSSNTSCRLITIGTNAADEVLLQKEIVSIFPNPVETEMLLTISEYIPEHGVVEVYDVMGRELLKQRVYYGWNNVDLSGLSSGTYIYKIVDNNKTIGEGNVVKL